MCADSGNVDTHQPKPIQGHHSRDTVAFLVLQVLEVDGKKLNTILIVPKGFGTGNG